MAVGVLATVHLVGLLWPSYYTWGFSFWAVVNHPVALIIIALCLLILFPPVSASVGSGVEKFSLSLASSQNLIVRRWVATFIFLLLTALFFVFRSRALVYGDGFIVASQFVSNSPITGYQDYLKLFSIGLPHLLGGVFEAAGLTEPADILSAVNALGGALAVFGLVSLAKNLTDSRPREMFLVLAGLLSGATILFFGYVEQYTWPTAMLLWCLRSVVRYSKEKSGPVPMIVLSLITVLFHILTAPILLAVLLALLIRHKENGYSILRTAGYVVIAVSLLIALAAQLLDLPTWLVLIWPKKDLPYSIITPDRWVDLLNNLLLLAPLPLFAFLSGRLKHEDSGNDLSVSLLGLTGLAGFLVMFWVEPKLGAARDFDFTSFYAIPLNVWAAYRLSTDIASERKMRIMIGVVLAALVIHLGGNLFEKNDLMLAGEHLDKIVTACPQHSPQYSGARRALVWGVLLFEDLKRPDLALPHFRLRTRSDPTDAAAWSNIGKIDFERERYQAAYISLKKAVELQPEHPYYLGLLADVEYKLGRLTDAAEHSRKAAQILPTDYHIQILTGLTLAKTGKYDEALQHFHIAGRLAPERSQPFFNMGTVYDELNQPDSARLYMIQALNRDSNLRPAYEPLIRNCLKLKRGDEARRIYRMYQSLFPSVPTLEEIKRQP